MTQDEMRRTRKKKKKKKTFKDYVTQERILHTFIVVILGITCAALAMIAVKVTPEGLFKKSTATADVTEEALASSTAAVIDPETAATSAAAETVPATASGGEPYSVVLESGDDGAESSSVYVDPAGNGKTYSDPGLRLWIGDSRTVGMEMYTAHSDKDVFIADIGMAYDWFEGSAVPQMKEYLDAGTATKVYILMGVNDCAAAYDDSSYNPAAEYTTLINSLVLDYPLTEFFFVSVGPGSGTYYGPVNISEMNDYIDGFNSYMKNKCAATYIDAAEYLKKTGYETTDGIHYKAATYQKIYYYVLDNSCYLISE